MTATRHRNTWIWLAVVAMSISVGARAQSGMQSARMYANPVFVFLASHSADQADAASGVERYLHSRTSRAKVPGVDSGAWAAMLPVFFIGLVAPLNQLSPRSALCIGRAPAAPLLPFSFQRPPPATLL
jgi:hypothetical protein